MSAINELENLVFSKIKEIKAFFALFKLETRLAAQSISPLLINLFLIVLVVISLWLSIMTLIGYCAFLVFNTIFSGLLSVLILNIVLVFGLFKYLQYNLRNISFEKTRHYWNETNHELEKTTACSNSDDKQDTGAPTLPGDKA